MAMRKAFSLKLNGPSIPAACVRVSTASRHSPARVVGYAERIDDISLRLVRHDSPGHLDGKPRAAGRAIRAAHEEPGIAIQPPLGVGCSRVGAESQHLVAVLDHVIVEAPALRHATVAEMVVRQGPARRTQFVQVRVVARDVGHELVQNGP